ncbi:hypothetical protein GCM10028805_55270 [Spirosoma harenae]
MKTNFIGFLCLISALAGCQPEWSVDPTTAGPDPIPYKIVRDSLLAGSYLGITIHEEAASVYPKIQALQSTKGVGSMNVVSNIYADLSVLKERIPLYQYILLDEKTGTDSGVQITIEGQSVKTMYLNSGKKLSQWPEQSSAIYAVRTGDSISSLYDKLAVIRSISAYSRKFDRISLLTKNLSTGYDPGMNQSPQWYFGYKTGADQMDQIQVHFQTGKVSKIYIDHYSKY